MNHTATCANRLIRELQDCKPGRAFAAEYESICCRILRSLFPDEFFIFREQYPTHDGRYRTDLHVSLNANALFWQKISERFRSRYAVFEFKNYGKKVNSRDVDLTKKYYCKDAERNVIFLISRRGLDPNGRTTADKTLRDSQLMMELTDADLIKMLQMKSRGEDPSLHMMRKYDLLMMGACA